MKVLVLGDLHLPFVNWEALGGILHFVEEYQPDRIVQVGDFIDGYSWSRFARDPDGPNAQTEWEMVLETTQRLHDIFPEDLPWDILEGNHDRRYQMRAFEVNLPSALIRPLREMFPYKNWNWHVSQRPLVHDNVVYLHGDEAGGSALSKAKEMGQPVCHGHLHKDAGIDYSTLLSHEVYGMNVGTLMDCESIAARYAKKALLRSWIGWGTITDGLPHLYPWSLMEARYAPRKGPGRPRKDAHRCQPKGRAHRPLRRTAGH